MASTQVNPTRMELTRQKKKLVTATKGHKLLKDKRDELMRQFLDLVRENMALRQKVEAGIKAANKNFVIAKAGMSEETLHTALMAPKQEVYLETDKKNVMSVDIPVFEYKTRTADENERSTQIRLMKVKDMMLEQTHHYKEKQAGYAVEIEQD